MLPRHDDENAFQLDDLATYLKLSLHINNQIRDIIRDAAAQSSLLRLVYVGTRRLADSGERCA